MKKRIALVLCLAMIAGMFAGCDVDINSILATLPGFSTQPTEPTEPTEPETPEPIVTTPSTNPGLVVGGTTDPTRPGMM